MTSASARPYALVVGLDLNGLGVVRSLAAAGIPVAAVDTRLDKPTARTRHARTMRIATLGDDEGAASGPILLDELARVERMLGDRPVLFLTQERTVATLAPHADALGLVARAVLPPAATVACLLDKGCFQARAEEGGHAIPRAVTVAAASTPEALAGLRFPCIVKPAQKYVAYGPPLKKAYRAADAAEVLKLLPAMLPVAPRVTVQEWIEGGDGDVYFCLQARDRTGRARASFVGRKVRQWPPATGGTATATVAPEARDELDATTDRFFTAAGVVGLCSMEYKRDRRDGRFYMVEPTIGRSDYQEEVATVHGVNLPAAAYAAELGLPVAPAMPIAARLWVDPHGEANAIRATGPLDPPDAAERLPRVDALFRWNDPAPWVAVKAEAVRRRLGLAHG